MSIHFVDPAAQAMEREMYAKYLEQFAHELRSTANVPKGISVHIFYTDGQCLRRKRFGEAFNLFEAIGIYEYSKAELLAMVGRGSPPVAPPMGPTG